ncbi:hypothetical protein ACFLYB_06645 [Chloroflexota bacterium]
MDTRKILRAITSGRKRSITEPFSAPYFSARFVNGHLPLFKKSSKPFIKIAAIGIKIIALKSLDTPAYSR